MKEIIKDIKDVENHKLPDNDWQEFDGYLIVTDKQEIFVGITNFQSCCESWGYFITNDNKKDFIGAELKSIAVVNKSLDEKIMKEKFEYGLDEGAAMFVNIETDKGTLQFTAYNAHNGYYGHTAVINSNQLSETVGL